MGGRNMPALHTRKNQTPLQKDLLVFIRFCAETHGRLPGFIEAGPRRQQLLLFW